MHVEISYELVGPISPRLARRLSDAAIRCNIRLPDAWSESRRKRQLLLLELVLLHAKNAVTFNVAVGPTTTFADIAAAHAAEDDAVCLPALETLSVGPHDANANFELGQAQPLLQVAPNLKTLFISRCFEFASMPRVPRVVDLNLHNCAFSAEMATEFITSCARLEVFNMATTVSIAISASLKVVISALRSHRTSLRSLSLDVPRHRGDYLAYSNSSEELRDFEKLESLFISLATIGGFRSEAGPPGSFLARFLPNSIRRLHLTDQLNPVIPRLQGLEAEMQRGAFPGLTEVAVNVGPPETEWLITAEAMSGLVALGLAWSTRPNFRLLTTPANRPMYEWL